MPRLLPVDWIKIIAINYLLRLYEQETCFVQEWGRLKQPFTLTIEQMGKISILIEVEQLLMKSPPNDLISWISDLQKLRNYLRDLQVDIEQAQNSLEMSRSYDNLLERLTPYVSSLNRLAYDWNLCAPWAGEELMRRDVQRVQQETFDNAGITKLRELSDRQIRNLLCDESQLSTYIRLFYPSVLSLYLSGGRVGYLNKLNRELKKFEKELKISGLKEPPSALDKHAKWWFEHYVYNKSFNDIASEVANSTGNPEGVYIRKAIMRFSKLIDVDPVERN